MIMGNSHIETVNPFAQKNWPQISSVYKDTLPKWCPKNSHLYDDWHYGYEFW